MFCLVSKSQLSVLSTASRVEIANNLGPLVETGGLFLMHKKEKAKERRDEPVEEVTLGRKELIDRCGE